MRLIFIHLEDEAGNKEATAHKFNDGEELPDGQWLIKYPDGSTELTDDCLMSDRWRSQVEKAVDFGKTL
jgi:hypothetical protein